MKSNKKPQILSSWNKAQIPESERCGDEFPPSHAQLGAFSSEVPLWLSISSRNEIIWPPGLMWGSSEMMLFIEEPGKVPGNSKCLANILHYEHYYACYIMVNVTWNKFPGGHGASCRGWSSSWAPWSIHSTFPMMPYRPSPAPVKATCACCCSAPPGWWAWGTSTCGRPSARASPRSAGSLCPPPGAPLPAAGGGRKEPLHPNSSQQIQTFSFSLLLLALSCPHWKNTLYLDPSMCDWFLLSFSKKPSFTLNNEYF